MFLATLLAVLAFAAVLALGWYVRTFGTPGQRTYLYAHLSALLTAAAALGAFLVSQGELLAQAGLHAGTLAVVFLAAKFADWLNQIWGRQVTPAKPAN